MAEAPAADMLNMARAAMTRAYAPYSGFSVGAVVRGESGKLYAGCNVENAAYPLSSCAEASAISALIMAGERCVIEVLVIGQGSTLISPCGGCRQRLSEFAADATPIHLCGPDGVHETLTLGELLPRAFRSQNIATTGLKTSGR
jgi:cytidine deaminase